MKSAIVTGATGFIGKTLVKKLAKSGIRVYAVVRSKAKAKDLIGLQNVIVIECEMSNYFMLKNYIKESIDIFYHFAWNGTTGSERASYDVQIDNIKFSCDAIQVSKELQVKKFIFAGSIIEYEKSNKGNNNLNNIYGVAKSTVSKIGKLLAESNGISFIHLIISNVYGVGEINDRFIKSILKKIINNESIELTPCEQLYDFIYIDDAIEAIYLIGVSRNIFEEYYIGNINPKQLKEFIHEIKDTIGSSINFEIGKILFNGAGLDYTEFSTKSLYEEYGFSPKVDFNEGIKLTKEWLMKEVEN